MVALEAWAVGTPVIANAQCDVLLGQCLRSNAGLYYADAAEFGAVLDTVGPNYSGVVGGSPKGPLLCHAAWVGDPGVVLDEKLLELVNDEQGARNRFRTAASLCTCTKFS